jgi:hypothetical protein
MNSVRWEPKSLTTSLRRLAVNVLLLVGSLLLCFLVMELGARLLVSEGKDRWALYDIQPNKKISFVHACHAPLRDRRAGLHREDQRLR